MYTYQIFIISCVSYACRLDKIEEPEVYQYEDALDHFEREPYGIFVKPKEIGERT